MSYFDAKIMKFRDCAKKADRMKVTITLFYQIFSKKIKNAQY